MCAAGLALSSPVPFLLSSPSVYQLDMIAPGSYHAALQRYMGMSSLFDNLISLGCYNNGGLLVLLMLYTLCGVRCLVSFRAASWVIRFDINDVVCGFGFGSISLGSDV
jgi:hypothetical protein